jgi:adenosylhomocysteine nucleosidase
MRPEGPPWLIAAAVEQEIEGIRAGVPAQRTVSAGHNQAWAGEWRGEPLLLVRTGIGPQRAREGLAPFLAGRDCRGIVSTGYAGGLRVECRLGDILIPEEVQTVPPLPEARFRPDPVVRERILERVRTGPWRIHTDRMITSERAILSNDEKHQKGLEYDAASVEMESAVIAELAKEASVPFVVVRVVLDEASFSLPDLRSVFRLYRRRQFGRLVPYVATHPHELVGLLRLLHRCRRASRSLDRFFLTHLLDGLVGVSQPPEQERKDI